MVLSRRPRSRSDRVVQGPEGAYRARSAAKPPALAFDNRGEAVRPVQRQDRSVNQPRGRTQFHSARGASSDNLLRVAPELDPDKKGSGTPHDTRKAPIHVMGREGLEPWTR
jgi:hypothetical protein